MTGSALRAGILFLAATATLSFSIGRQGFFLDSWQPKTLARITQYTAQTPPSTVPTVTVTINAADTITKIPKYIYGQNINGWMGRADDNATKVRHYRNAGLTILRMPGGSWADIWFWNALDRTMIPSLCATAGSIPNLGTPQAGGTDNTNSMTMPNQYRLCDAVGAEGIITVNYGYARYGGSSNPVATAAKYAADWVRDVNIVRRRNVKYWEVGNENFGSWEAGYDVSVCGRGIQTGTQYGRDFCVFVDSMKKVDPTIKIGAVVQPVWQRQVLPEVKDKADFLVVHIYYPEENGTPTLNQLFAGVTRGRTKIEELMDDVATCTGKARDYYPIALTEWNIQATGTRGVGPANAIFHAMATGEHIKNGWGLVTTWDLHNGYSNGTDHGLLAANNEPGVAEGTPHCYFFANYYYHRCFGDVLVPATATSATMAVYASRFSSGQFGIVVVNVSANSQTVRLTTASGPVFSRYYWWEISTDNIEGRNIAVNNVNGTQESGGPDNYESVLPWSAHSTGEITITSKPYSANFIVAESSPSGVLPAEGSSSLPDRRASLRRLAGGNVELTMEIIPGGRPPSLTVTGLSGKTILRRPLVRGGDRYRSGTFVLPRGAHLLSVHEGPETVCRRKIVID
ncbi:MAG: hypothetical protein JXA71_08690 [Chitinispirillaceae bacterium]|nr:hypothetical protein [Chitinispirillaceae bacterium]